MFNGILEGCIYSGIGVCEVCHESRERAANGFSDGENRRTQFKQNIFETKKLAEEMVAFSNAEGGVILVGVADNGERTGLSDEDIHRLNQMVSNTSSENVKPPIYPIVQIERIGDRKVMAVLVRKGVYEPYCTSSGLYLTKAGADKRKMSPDELRPLFAESGWYSADESVNEKSGIQDLDMGEFNHYFRNKRNRDFQDAGLDLQTVLTHLNLFAHGHLTLAGTLFFAVDPQRFYPPFTVQALCVDGTVSASHRFLNKKYFGGNMRKLLEQSLLFLKATLRNIQDRKSFNTPDVLEIPEPALEEVIVNALIHRDYYISAPIKILIYDDRVEVVSPGKLPNALTVEKIKSGLSIARNPISHSIAPFVLAYSGFGTGIERIVSLCSSVQFINDVEGEMFACVIPRRGFATEAKGT